MHRILNIIAAMGIALMMAACETAPLVVEDLPPPEMKVARELLVLPLAGMSPSVGVALSEKMAWGLREAGYPARSTSLSDATSPILTGWIEEATDGGDVIWLDISWALYGAGGRAAGQHNQKTAVSREGWAQLSPDSLAVIVAEAVPAIHEIAEPEVFPNGMPFPRSTFTDISGSEGKLDAGLDLMPGQEETVVVSGEGFSRIDASGNEIVDQSLSIAGEPTFAPEYAPDYVQESVEPVEDVQQVIQAMPLVQTQPPELTEQPEPIAQPIAQPIGQTGQIAFPQGFSAGAPILPEDNDARDARDVNAAEMVPTPTADAPVNRDDVGLLTPQSAALVTTLPELTIAETIVPGQGVQMSGGGEDFMDLEPEPESGTASDPEPVSVDLAPGVSQQSTVQVPQVSQVAQAPQPSATSVNPQPVLADGNAALGFVRPVFLVRHITGAPGDGNIALRTAILQSLRGADAMVTDNPAEASYALQGSVQMDAPFAGRQHIRIIWLVTTIAGAEVGTAVQENDVPQGSLDGKWGEVAQAVTNAAIPGITRLFSVGTDGGIDGLDAGSANGNLAQPDLPHVLGDPLP